MKYYSERLNKFYNTAVECEQAEFAAKRSGIWVSTYSKGFSSQ